MTSSAQRLLDAVEWVRSGSSVDVIGRRFSGRTHFLRELRVQLEEEGWRTLCISGNAFLQGSPLSALDLAGVVDGTTRGRSPLHAAMDGILEPARGGRFAVLIDDWDSLDEASWGVLIAAHQRAGFPIVRATLRRRALPSSPTGTRDAQSLRTFVVDLTPMRIDELERVLASHLDGPIDNSTLARILAKSGGIVGLALTMADAAQAEGTLQQIDDVWHAHAGLWTDSLTRIAEAYTAGISGEELDVLEALALVGELDATDARTALDWNAVESLEDRGLIRLYSIGSRQLVTVVPPLVTEMLRNQTHRARRERVLHDIMERGVLDGDTTAERLSTVAGHAWEQPDALFVRSLDEHNRMQRAAARARWLAEPSPTTAVPYLQVLNDQGAETDEIERVFGGTDASAGDDESRAYFSVQLAWWRAAIEDDLDGAIAHLAAVKTDLGRYGRLADAAAVDIRSTFLKIPDDVEETLHLDGINDLPTPVRDKINESRMATFFSLGQFDKARIAQQFLSENKVTASVYAPALLTGLLGLFDGHLESTIDSSIRAFHRARGLLDTAGIRSYGYLSAVGLTIAGRRTDAQPFIDVALSLGRAPRIPPIMQLGVVSLGSLLAFRRGDAESAGALQAQRRNLPFTDSGVLPFGLWPEAQRAVGAGNVALANDRLWTTGLEKWDRGARVAGLLSLFAAVELEYTRQRAATLEELVDAVDGTFFRLQLDYVRAQAARSEPALVQAAQDLTAEGLSGRALGALKTIQAVRTGHDGRELESADLLELADEMGLPLTLTDPFDFLGVLPKLSRREVEVAENVAEGMSNQQVAEKLGLSVRTVENHIHRILRKTGIEGRDGLAEFMKAASSA